MKRDDCGLRPDARHCQSRPGNDNSPFDEKEWRRAYMRRYMRQRRQRAREEEAK